MGWQVGVFTLAGIATCFKYRPSSMVLSYFLVSAAFFGVLLLVFYGERFSMFLLPVYAALALKALSLPSLAKYRFWNTIQIGGIVAIALVIWTGYDSIEFNQTTIDSGPREVLSFGNWFHQTFGDSEHGKIVIARKPHIAYYLGMKLEMFPYVETYRPARRGDAEVEGLVSILQPYGSRNATAIPAAAGSANAPQGASPPHLHNESAGRAVQD